MAMAYLGLSKNARQDATRDMHNVSPFHDPRNPQFGVGSQEPPRPLDPPGRGTAGELRGRKYSLRGSYSRTQSAPPHAQPTPTPPPHVMLDSDVDFEPERETEKEYE